MHPKSSSESAKSSSESPTAFEKPSLGDCHSDHQGPRSFRHLFRRHRIDLDSIATQPSVFDDPLTLEVHRPPPQYENTHRFDPDARWTWREEKVSKVVRKIDLRIMIWAGVMFFALDLDRTNISQANTDNFLQDLHLTTNDFNLGNTLYRLSFLIAELPSQLISKRVGPDVWVPIQISLWSMVALSQFWLSDRKSFLATRFLLGFLEGGFIPDIVLYLSYFYTKRELPIRLAWFWVSNYITVMFSAFLATGILSLRSGNRAGWRYLFLIEGLITLSVGIISYFLMPPGPTQTKAWFRPKGWFTEREEVIMVNRVLRDDPTKSDMHNREGLTVGMIWNAICDWRMWPIYVLGITHMIPVGPPQTYLTLSLRNLGFTTTQSNLLTLPSTACGLLTLLLTSYLAEFVHSRVGACLVLQIWALPLLVALRSFGPSTDQWDYFTVVTLITGFPYVHPIQVAWASRNSGSVRTRTISASVYNMFVQAGVIVYVSTIGTVWRTHVYSFQANIYRADDAPLYKRGNLILIIICSANFMIYILTYFFYRGINRHREEQWNTMTVTERDTYLETTKDQGNKRLDFRFAY
ncbi:major facilitator superfamily domain-containing protein [Suillus paluster]|uniref:major facilitator superfamily domain-containing protein n=1 Tax=Suillus paluster TaxID=48578 RepID=UPI001B86DE3A|nr:major facilitator superfamily domain-containing protein [Suillus paluster]KAG1754764.1 major facilitator superfamily domain-containing protein [Suillus paluster]